MALYKQPGSEVWWASLSHNGERLRVSTGEHDRQAAQRFHDERKAALWKRDPALKGKTWGNAVLKWVEATPRSDSELLSLAKFAGLFKDRPLSAVTPEDIDRALLFCQTAGTHKRYTAMLAAILNLSDVRLKLIQRRDKKTKPRDWITHEQWDTLRAELPPHMLAMATFAVTTGLRQANVLELQWSRVDLKRRVVWVEAENMKGGKAIAIPLSEEATAVLVSVQGVHPEFCFTFRGRRVGEIKTAWASANIRAGTGRLVDGKYSGFTWHGLRHTWATWHIQNGTPLEVLQRLGGWSDLRMVLLYAHHSPGHLAGYADNARRNT
ncbi:tyrosine-type recombinase/integrase [Rhodoferax sp.]|uniref:tyrosine-type recombinase/integrase n=1 Tax=Rhodoferax sp. TaxID=50421 RepID=UPI0027500EAF|nr:site-specific integrase [Rhodoferax sp.]